MVTTGYEQLNNSSVEIHNAFWREILPKLSDAPLPADPEAHASLLSLGASLEMLRPDGALTSPMAQKVSGVTYEMADNSLGFKWMRFEFEADQGVMHYENATGVHAIPFGFGKQVTHEFPESHVNGYRIGEPMDRGMNCYSSAAWTMPHSLMIYCQVVDLHLAQLRFAVCFKGDTITIHPQKHAEFFLETYNGFASGQAVFQNT